MYLIGSICKLKRGLLCNTAGTMGVVYELYPDKEKHGEFGISVIFQNGRFSRFSVRDQDLILSECGFSPECCGYLYTDNQQLTEDYNNGLFKPALFNGIYMEQREEAVYIDPRKRSRLRIHQKTHVLFNEYRF